MSEHTHFGAFVDHITSDDDSELGKMRAERDYALHCLEREIAICAQTQMRNDALVEALATIADIAEGSGTLNSFPNIAKIARGALASIKERA